MGAQGPFLIDFETIFCGFWVCFSDFLAFQGPVPLVPLRSRTLRTLQRYSGEWAPLPSELSGTCLYRYIYIYIYCRMRSENRPRAQSPTSIVPVACAGACAGAGVPRSVFLEPFGEHFAPFCMHGAPFSEHWAPALRLRSPGLAKCSILDDFRAKKESPLGIPFSPWDGTFALCGVSEAENRCFFWQPGLRPHFGTISGQILGGPRL